MNKLILKLTFLMLLFFTIGATAQQVSPPVKGVGTVVKRNRPPNYGSKVTANTNEKGETTVEITEKGNYVITVLQPTPSGAAMTETQGQPIRGVKIGLAKHPGNYFIRFIPTNDKGEAEFKDLEPGSYTIKVESANNDCPTGFHNENGVCLPNISVEEGYRVWTTCEGGKIECYTTNSNSGSDSWTKASDADCASRGKVCDGAVFGDHIRIKKLKIETNQGGVKNNPTTATNYVGHVTLLRYSQWYLGGGLQLPSSTTKTSGIVNGIDVNLGYYYPIWTWDKSNISLGVNGELGYTIGNGSYNINNQYKVYQLAGQVREPLITENAQSTKSASFRGGAGLQMNIHFGKFLVSPIINAGYLSTTQKSFSVDETIYPQGTPVTYRLLEQKETKTSGIGILPKLRFTYMLSPNIGIWLEGHYTIGPKINTETTRFVIDPSIPLDYINEGNFQEGQYITTKNETNFSAVGLNGGLVVSLVKGRGGKPKGNNGWDVQVGAGISKTKENNEGSISINSQDIISNADKSTESCCTGLSFKNPIVKNSKNQQVFTFDMSNCQSAPFTINPTQQNCDENYTIGTSLNCGKCNSQITYSLYSKPNNTLVQSSSNGIFQLSSSLASGVYDLKIEYKCGDEVCKSCTFIIRKSCGTTNNQNCCNQGIWDELNYFNNKNEQKQLGKCGSDLGVFKCGETLKLKTCFLCAESCGQISGNTTYQIFNASTNVAIGDKITNTNCSATNITLPNQGGNYYITLTPSCGSSTCEPCKYYFTANCETTNDCCLNGKWQSIYHAKRNNPNSTSIGYLTNCNQTYTYDYIPNMNLIFSANYQCATGACSGLTLMTITKNNTPVVSNVNVGMPYLFTPNSAGTYTITYSAKCNDKICDICTFTIVLNEKPADDCCKNGYWKNKSIDWTINLHNTGVFTTQKSLTKPYDVSNSNTTFNPKPTSGSIPVECGTNTKLSLHGTYTLNASYQCFSSSQCNTKVSTSKVTIAGPDSTLNGTYTLPKQVTFNIAGTYTIIYKANCGDKECETCQYTVQIDKNCCEGGKWNTAQYMITNKKPNGDWDKSDPRIYNLPLSLVNGIPTLKADVAIDVENLNYTCGSGCTTSYKVKRKNLTSSVYEPDELLTNDKNDCSIYTKPYPQMIWIIPICDGQECTNGQIMFKLECKNKDCIEHCNSNKSINISTGIDEQGNLLQPNTIDLLWNNAYTYNNAPYPAKNSFILGNSRILMPSINSPMATGDFTFKRSFVICKYGNYKLTGVLRCDNQLRSFVIKNSSGSIIWTLQGIPTTYDNFNNNVNLSNNLNLTAGKYEIEVTYRNRKSTLGDETFGGLALNGTITTTNGEINNHREACCPKPPTSTVNPTDGVGQLNPNLNLEDIKNTDSECGSWEYFLVGNANNVDPNFQPLNNGIICDNPSYWDCSRPIFKGKYNCGKTSCTPKYIFNCYMYWNMGHILPNNAQPSFVYSVTSTDSEFYKMQQFASGDWGRAEILVECCGKICDKITIDVCPHKPLSMMIPNNGIFNNTKQMLSKEEITTLLKSKIPTDYEQKSMSIIKTEDKKYKLMASYFNESTKTIKSFSIDLKEQKDGFLTFGESGGVISTTNLQSGGEEYECECCGTKYKEYNEAGRCAQIDSRTGQCNSFTKETHPSGSEIERMRKNKPYIGHVTLLR